MENLHTLKRVPGVWRPHLPTWQVSGKLSAAPLLAGQDPAQNRVLRAREKQCSTSTRCAAADALQTLRGVAARICAAAMQLLLS